MLTFYPKKCCGPIENSNLHLSILIGLMLVISSFGLRAQKKEIDGTELEVLRHIIQNDTVPTVYFKTTVSEMNQPLSRHLFYLSDFDLCSTLEKPDSAKLKKEESWEKRIRLV